MNIKYVKYKNIDKIKWDNCITNAQNGNVYGYSWYLDTVAVHWDALVLEDYTAVFPLPCNRKLLGIQQIFQPLFTQQLGIYSLSDITETTVQSFLNAIPKHFKLVIANLNENNILTESLNFKVFPRPNLLLNLNQPYRDLYKNYNKSLRRNLKKATANELKLTTQTITTNELVTLYKETVGFKIPLLDDKAYDKITTIINTAIQRKKGKIIGIEDDTGKVCTAGFFLFSHGRIINLFGSSTNNGKTKRGMHFLLDTIIKENAHTPQVFDFEGSSIPSIAAFFKSFGAEERPYYNIKKNNLPFWLKTLKKI